MKTNSQAGKDGRSPLEDLLRLQTDFQQRLAGETLKYLGQLQGLVGPVVPGTIIAPDADAGLTGKGLPGTVVNLEASLENRQRAHCMVTPMLSPFVSEKGVTWFPDAVMTPPSALLATNESITLTIAISIPDQAPSGNYHGALILYGLRGGGTLPIRFDISPMASKPVTVSTKGKTARSKNTTTPGKSKTTRSKNTATPGKSKTVRSKNSSGKGGKK